MNEVAGVTCQYCIVLSHQAKARKHHDVQVRMQRNIHGVNCWSEGSICTAKPRENTWLPSAMRSQSSNPLSEVPKGLPEALQLAAFSLLWKSQGAPKSPRSALQLAAFSLPWKSLSLFYSIRVNMDPLKQALSPSSMLQYLAQLCREDLCCEGAAIRTHQA